MVQFGTLETLTLKPLLQNLIYIVQAVSCEMKKIVFVLQKWRMSMFHVY